MGFLAKLMETHSNGGTDYNKFTLLSTDETTDATIGDYVVEQGTDGIWTYRKWASGIAECWGYTATGSLECSSPWGNGYYSALQTVYFPDGLFASIPKNVQLTMWDNGGGFYATMKTWNKNDVQYYVWSPKSETRSNVDTNIFAIGRWK